MMNMAAHSGFRPIGVAGFQRPYDLVMTFGTARLPCGAEARKGSGREGGLRQLLNMF